MAPIPASITSGVPHAVRTINFLPTFQILTALGLLQSFYFLRGLNIKFGKRDLRKPVFSTLIGLFLLIATFNFVYYLNQYFVQQNYYYSQSWQYGYHEAIDFVKPIAHKYDKIVVTNERPLDQSYIFFLFYLKYNPELYQMSGGTVSGGFAEAHKGFDKYVFEPIKFGSHEGKVLYIGNPGDIPPSSVIKSINFLDGQEAIRIGDANER